MSLDFSACSLHRVRMISVYYKQGGHKPGKPGKHGKLREFERLLKPQGKLREI